MGTIIIKDGLGIKKIKENLYNATMPCIVYNYKDLDTGKEDSLALCMQQYKVDLTKEQIEKEIENLNIVDNEFCFFYVISHESLEECSKFLDPNYEIKQVEKLYNLRVAKIKNTI